MNQIISRPIYIDHVLDDIDRGMMIFLVGQRRVGKSFILLQLEVVLKELHPDSNIIYISRELNSFRHLNTSDDLYNYVSQRLSSQNKNYVLIDEVQEIDNFQVALRNLYAERNCQLIATGSNFKIFSSELSTLIGGRYIEIPVYPLSYNEFLLFHNLMDSDESLRKFLRVGGLPGLRLFDIDNERQVTDYLQGVFSTIMMRDIILRHQFRNSLALEKLINFIADNIGKLFSVRKVTNSMNSKGEKITDHLTGMYLKYLEQAYLIATVARFDIHGKYLFESLNKPYFTDQGLRNLLCGFEIRWSIEKVMENVIYNQLRISGYRVYVGVLKNAEVDFVAEKGSKRIYIQSTYMLGSAETIEREFGNLKAIKDNYPKYVVSMESISGGFPEYPGILHVSLREFLSNPPE